jgi:Repeat of Unknown Function (DUF347)
MIRATRCTQTTPLARPRRCARSDATADPRPAVAAGRLLRSLSERAGLAVSEVTERSNGQSREASALLQGPRVPILFVTMTLGLGYLAGTAIFAAALLLLPSAQIKANRFYPFLYWAVITATTLAGTTLADFFDRSLGIGYFGGSLSLFTMVLATLGLGYWSRARHHRGRRLAADTDRRKGRNPHWHRDRVGRGRRSVVAGAGGGRRDADCRRWQRRGASRVLGLRAGAREEKARVSAVVQ